MYPSIVLYIICLLAIASTAYLALRVLYLKEVIAEHRVDLSRALTVDPWVSQSELMHISSQPMARRPQCTKTSVLYGALILEEGSETLAALSKALIEVTFTNDSDYREVAKSFAKVANYMHNESVRIRMVVADSHENLIDAQMSYEVADELLDGVTDLHVVTAGLSAASCLPGQAAYAQVGYSNLSKANPVTGMIDKDAGGKWIKGPNYREPDFSILLGHYYAGSDV